MRQLLRCLKIFLQQMRCVFSVATVCVSACTCTNSILYCYISLGQQPMKVSLVSGSVFQDIESALNDKSADPQRFWSVDIYICIYYHTHTYIHIYIYYHTHTYIHIYILSYTYIHIPIYYHMEAIKQSNKHTI